MIAQLPCAFGKTIILLLLAHTIFVHYKKPVLLAVPTEILKRQLVAKARGKCKFLSDFDPKKEGLFIITIKDLENSIDENDLGDVFLLVDEFHSLIEKPWIEKYVNRARNFISFTATIGFT